MPGLEDLYREIILDHYRAPRNRGELPVPPAHKAEGFNPLCGDEVVLYLDVDGDTVTRPQDRRSGLLDQPGVDVDDERGGEGPARRRGPPAHPCVQGADVDPRVEARGRGRRLRPPAELEGVRLGDLEALQGVVKFPVRIKCATLPGHGGAARGLGESVPLVAIPRHHRVADGAVLVDAEQRRDGVDPEGVRGRDTERSRSGW